MISAKEEKNLVARFQRGDSDAFAELYRLHGARIFRYCYRLTGRVADAEDLTQEVFVAAFQGRERFEGRASLFTWLYRIAFNIQRASQRKADNIESADLDENQCSTNSPISDVIVDMVFAEALEKLTVDQRDAFLLVRIEGLTHREAATVLGEPMGTVQARVFAASLKLRHMLSESDGRQSQTTEHAQNRAEVAIHEM